MEYTIVQRTKYEFDIYENITSSYSIYLGKTCYLNIADKICYDRMNDTKRYGKINKILIDSK